jgi:asparagine synthetase B (glutamine-hydrolysing)
VDSLKAEFNKKKQSYYLAFRFNASNAIEEFGVLKNSYKQVLVSSAGNVDVFLQNYIKKMTSTKTGILLSGGIDSAIIASYLPKGTRAYTVKFASPGFIDESIMAKKYADKYGLIHKTIEVNWEDYEKYMPLLMQRKGQPLHAMEVALYKASLIAKSDGIDGLFVGNGADSIFGGMDKLLSKDWTFDEFVKRYTFVQPSDVLIDAVPISSIYEHYRMGENIDYVSFIEQIYGTEIIQAYKNAITSAGCEILDIYENLKLSIPLDVERIRNGESKYILRELFRSKYPDFELNEKIAFARPMEEWLKNWEGPIRSEFKENCLEGKNGDQKWLIFCLEKFLNSIGN